jgi:hypothetical protein
VIFNNRTAFAFNTKLESPNATQIALFVSGSSLIRVRCMLSRTPYTGRRCNPLMMLAMRCCCCISLSVGCGLRGKGHAGDLGAGGGEQPWAAAIDRVGS